jgi:hypothetical protein
VSESNPAPKSLKRKIGVSATPPKSEARPLGTPSKKGASARAVTKANKQKAPRVVVNVDMSASEKKVFDNVTRTHVDSASQETTSVESTSTNNPASEKGPVMQITLVKSNKNRKSTSVVFNASNGLRGSARFAKTFFKDGNAPDTLVIDGDAFASPKEKLTAEQRKELRKQAPKLSASEKLAKLQERAAKLQAKIAAEAAAPSSM